MNDIAKHIEYENSLDQVLSILRHELGNPINSLKITLDVFKENYDLFDDNKKKEYLRRGSTLLARLERLVEAMRSYSRFDVKDREEIAFPHFWEHLISLIAKKAKDRDIKLSHNHDVGDRRILGDTSAIDKVIINIIDNAIEATEEVKNPEIEIKASATDDFIIISVKDNGTGISEQDLSKALLPLFSTKSGKQGMGLPIAKRLLFKMDGQIKMESLLGEGTEVTVCLRTASGQESPYS